MSQDDSPTPLDEYREIGINWRYWGEQRFKQLTAFLTITGALYAAAFSELVVMPATFRRASSVASGASASSDRERPVRISDQTTAVSSRSRRPLRTSAARDGTTRALIVLRFMIAMLGMVSTILFFVIDERATFYRRAYMERAKWLELHWLAHTPSAADYYPWMYHWAYNSLWPKLTAAAAFRSLFGAVFFTWGCYLFYILGGTPLLAVLILPLTALVIWLGVRLGRFLQESIREKGIRERISVDLPRSSRALVPCSLPQPRAQTR